MFSMLLANKFHVRFNKLCTTSELLVRQSVRTSTTSVHCAAVKPNVWPFVWRSGTERCATRDGRHFLATSVRWKNRYATQKVSLRSEFQWCNFLSCLGDNQRFGDCHRILSLFLFASSLLGVLVRTLILKFASSL